MSSHIWYDLNNDTQYTENILHPLPVRETPCDPMSTCQSSALAFLQSVSKWIFCNCRFLISFSSLFPPILLKTGEHLCSEQEGKKVLLLNSDNFFSPLCVCVEMRASQYVIVTLALINIQKKDFLQMTKTLHTSHQSLFFKVNDFKWNVSYKSY